jgi:cell division protein FtsN
MPKVSGRSEKTYQAVEETNPIIRQRRIRRWIYTGAAACLVASMILIPMKMGYLNLSSFDLSPVDSFRKEQPVKELVVPSHETDSQLLTPETGTSAAETAFTGIESESLQTETVPSEIEAPGAGSEDEIPARKYFTPQKNYHIIVGSFKDIGNAQHLQQKMIGEGYDAEVITGENDFFRVSARQFPSKADAVSALPTIRGQEAYKSAWILSL